MTSHPVAIIANTGLGDALHMMIVAQNFATRGHPVRIYNNFLVHLKTLFPQITVSAYPEVIESLFSQFDRVIIQEHAPGSKLLSYPDHVCVIKKKDLDLTKSLAHNLQLQSQKFFHLSDPVCGIDLGIQPPKDWIFRAHIRRVVLHPTSANSWKNWPSSKFIHLAQKLQRKQFLPHFVLPQQEMAEWSARLKAADLPPPLCLDWISLAKFLYESGYFIGNDASIGHLASSLHIPTLSIFDRKSRACFWRPSWAPGTIALPSSMLCSRALIKAFWKQFLSVNKAYRSFRKLNLIVK